MADKSFGVKELNLISASGTPTITSPNSVNINATNVAISTDITVGGMVSLGAGTSISSPGTNVLTFGTNSTEKVRITSDGNVGINDTAPSQKLNVGGNIMLEGSDQYLYLTNVGTGNAGVYVRGRDATNELRSHSTGMFTWEVTGSEKMRLNSSGTLKIGGNTLATPNGNADNFVIDTGDVDSGLSILSATTGRIYFGDAADAAAGSIRYVHTDNSLRFEAAGGEKLRITSDGNLQAISASDVRLTLGSGGTAGTNDSVHMRADSNDLKFMCGNGGRTIFERNGTESLRITSGGDVVIGNSSAADGAHFQHYQSAARHQSFQSNNGDLAIVTDNNSNPAAYIKGTGTADLLRVFDNTTQIFTIKDGGNVEVNGNIVMGNGDGIDFAGNSNAAGMTSEVLDDYEEGSWTPTAKMEQAGQNASIDGVNAHYVKVGTLVHIFGQLDFNGTPSGRSTSAAVEIRNLPFAHQHGYDKISHDIRVTGWETGSTYGSDITFIMRMIANASYFRVEALQAGYNGTRNASLTVQDNTSYKFSFTYQTQ